MDMQQKRKMMAIGIIVVAILTSMFCAWPMLRLNSFYGTEARTVSRFDTLNSRLFATIPVPSGVIELEQSSSGITSPTTTHGRYLITDYQMPQTQPEGAV